MKKHNGMRPQDIVILLKIIAFFWGPNRGHSSKAGITFVPKAPQNKEIATELQISEAEVSESLRRSAYAGLLHDLKLKRVNKKSLLDFILTGLKYVFPTRPGPLVRGIPTAQSAPPLNDLIVSNEHYVWENAEGTVRGQMIEPLYPTVPLVAYQDSTLYELLALVDAVRTGSARTVNIASEELKKRLLSAE
ncbi:MAG: hypothetical protein KKG00_02335 [Bacteroidetes bacterium]|nr:hypothetical protein [Bacteroidota bacterium]